jgi:hypothetical protein
MRAEWLSVAAALVLAGHGPAQADDVQDEAKPATSGAPPPDAALLEFLGEFTEGQEWVDPIALHELRDRALDRAPKKKTDKPSTAAKAGGEQDEDGGESK